MDTSIDTHVRATTGHRTFPSELLVSLVALGGEPSEVRFLGKVPVIVTGPEMIAQIEIILDPPRAESLVTFA